MSARTGIQPGQAKPLERLRQLILQEDVKKVARLAREIDALQKRIDDTDEWLERLDPVIADALARRISESREEMAETLAPVMGAAIKTQIQDAKEDMVDALYPVIGSTIRKSIAEAMKNLVKTVNERVDRALSFQLLFKKVKAKVTGVSGGELILKESLPFQVHDVFLIHKHTGLLLCHVRRQGGAHGPHEEIVSGMLTAIREFASTALGQNGQKALHGIQYEDMEIYLEDGRHAYLAIVTSGVPPDAFMPAVKQCEQKIHNIYHKELRHFDGDTAAFEHASRLLAKLFHISSSPPSGSETVSSSNRGLVVVGLVLMLLVLLFSWKGKQWLAGRESVPHTPTLLLDQIVPRIDARLAELALKPAAPLRYTLDGDMLSVSGRVRSEEEKILVGKAIAEVAPVAVVINDLTFQRPLRVMPEPVKEQVEATRIFFGVNSTALSDQQGARVATVASILKSYPTQPVTLHGHSDDLGSEEVKRELSEKRAQVVKQALIAAGVAPERIRVVIWGADRPIASNASAKGRAQNRRVEFELPKDR